MTDDITGLQQLQQNLGYTFKDPSLLQRALTHPSYLQTAPETSEHYQRLEFLGDAALTLILAESLYHLMPDEREGVLTRNRSALAKGIQLCELARDLEIPRHLRLSEAEEANGGRERESILEDALEAVIGAIYLDCGLETTRKAILGWYGDLESRIKAHLSSHNPKGRLQELVQPTMGNEAILYRLKETSGPDHAKVYTVCVEINGLEWGHGVGTSKKEAEEQAAAMALQNRPVDTE